MNKKVVIIGSGASGVSAALGLIEKGIRPTLIDVGVPAPKNRPQVVTNNYFDLNQRDILESLLVGTNFCGIDSFKYKAPYLSPRLRAPDFKFVTYLPNEIPEMLGNNKYDFVTSFAQGGLANAWGAGAFRYTTEELRDSGLTYEILKPHYDKLSEVIGISGRSDDDLLPFFLEDSSLLPPVRLSKKSSYLLNNYKNKKSQLNASGIYIGSPRLALLTKDLSDRKKIEYQNTEFWDNQNEAIYSPRMTLNKLICENKVDYIPQSFVQRIRSNDNNYSLEILDLKKKSNYELTTEYLIVAAGTLQSSFLLLKSFRNLPQKIKVYDNFSFQVPFFVPSFFGKNLEKDSFGSADLSIVFNGKNYPTKMQAGVFNLTSIPRHELLSKIPLPYTLSNEVLKFMFPGMSALFVFVDNDGSYHSDFFLENNSYRINSPTPPPDIPYSKIMVDMIKIGAFTHPILFKSVNFGNSIHYTGTFSMKKQNPHLNGCLTDGSLLNHPKLFIADGSWMPGVGAKHPTFTFMAQAHRIGHIVSDRIHL